VQEKEAPKCHKKSMGQDKNDKKLFEK